MIKIINNILSSNGYKIVDLKLPLDNQKIYLFCPNQENQREEYFITIQLLTQSNQTAENLLKDNAEELFEAINNSGKVERHFVKNCTMFICHDEAKINRQTVLALEEDPYNFKKNVITYSSLELEDLEKYFETENIKKITNIAINEIINKGSGQNFLAFKDNHNITQNYYSLILKIALKLPFITYNPPEKELTNLCADIEKSFTEQHSLIYKQLMESELEWNENNTYQQVEQIWGNLK